MTFIKIDALSGDRLYVGIEKEARKFAKKFKGTCWKMPGTLTRWIVAI